MGYVSFREGNLEKFSNIPWVGRCEWTPKQGLSPQEVSVWGVRTDTDPHVGYDWKTSQWIFQVPVKGGR